MLQSVLFSEAPKVIGTNGASLAQRYAPRPYQVEAVREFYRLVDERNTPGALMRLATGCGKTFVFGWAAQEWLSRGPDHCVAVFAHERELVLQFREELEDLLQVEVGLEMSDDGAVDFENPNRPRIVCVSRATVAEDNGGRSRLYKFDWRKKWLVGIDEAHTWLYSLKSCRHIIDWFEQNPESRRLGLTATPERGDGVSLARLFPDVAIDYRLSDAIRDGWLLPFDQRYILVEGVDFKNLKEVAGDFDNAELDELMSERELLLSLCKPMLDHVEERRTIIFSPGVKVAKGVARTINAELGRNAAEWLDGTVPDWLRRETFRRHKGGEFQFLSVCNLCRVGYNDRGIGAVAVFRPTKSRTLAEQMKGRGVRPLKGTVDGLGSAEERKSAIAASPIQNCLVVDLVGVSGLGEVATTAHLLASGLPDEVVEEANKRAVAAAASGESVDVADELAKAQERLAEEERKAQQRAAEDRERALRERLEREEQERADRAARLQADVRYRAERVEDGLGGAYTSQGVVREPATEKQVWRLVQLGVSRKTAEGYSKRQASAVIEKKVKARAPRAVPSSSGAATEQQQHVLRKYGRPTDVSYEEAVRMILEINESLRSRPLSRQRAESSV